MDIIHQCVSLAPVPYLAQAFSAFRFIWSSVQQAQASKRQLEALAQSIAQLLQTLDREYHCGRLVQAKTSKPLADLSRLMAEISTFVQKEASCGFLKLLFTKDQRISRIEEYHQRISALVTSFQISALLNIQAWQAKNDSARAVDQQELNERLTRLEKNQQQLAESLNAHQRNMMPMVVSLQRRLQVGSDEDQERRFFTHTLQYLTTSSGRQVEIEDWMITSYEVEFGHEIGSGGFGQVFKGSWNKTTVALKVFMMEDGVTPSSAAIRNEIKIWSKIRHPNILQFLGANVLDDKPFIVMPYLKHGNAREYLLQHPNSDRLQILHDISLGLVYLHSHDIVHGDLKALNVLIDDRIKAVLCDFGLARVKADVTSRTAGQNGGGIVGSRNWMAPERLLGGSVKKPCDIYAFGMTLYEIYANETPLGELSFSELVELVVRQDVRPERPDDEDAPQLSDTIWALAEKCWPKDAKHRPTATVVCDTLSHLFDMVVIAQPTNDSLRPPIVPPTPPAPVQFNPSHPSTPQLIPTPELTPHAPIQAIPSRPSAPQPILTPQLTSQAPASTVCDTVPHSLDMVVIAQPISASLPPLVVPPTLPPAPAQSDPSRSSTPQPIPTPELTPQAPIQAIPSRPSAPQPILTHQLTPQAPASAVCDTVPHLLDMVVIAQPISASLPPLVVPPPLPPAPAQSDPSCSSTPQPIPTPELIPQAPPTIQPSPPRRLRRSQNLRMRGHTDHVYSATFSADGKYVVSGSGDCTISVWDVQTGKLALGPLKKHTHAVYCVAFSLDGRQIASGSDDNTIRVWSAVTGKTDIGPFKGHTNAILSVCFSPDGTQIASGSRDKTTRLWDAQTGEGVIDALTGHTESVTSIAFSGDGNWLASGSADNTVIIWDVMSGRQIQGPLRGIKHTVYFIGFCPDGKRIVSASMGGDVCVWDTDTGALISGPSKWYADSIPAVVFTPNSTYYCAVSPDGKWIVSRMDGDIMDGDNTPVHVWNLKTGKLAVGTNTHSSFVQSITFSPDSKHIVTASYDKTIQVHCLDV